MWVVRFVNIARFVGIVLLASVQAFAVTDSLPDSRGKDFWFCFPPNFHNGGIDEPVVQRRDSLYVFVAAEKPTNVTIEYRDSAGTLYTKRFRITDPKQVLSFGEKFYPFELMGFNRCGDRLDLTSGQNLRVAKQYFHVQSDEDVTVYAMSQALTTSDAFLVLPTDALGNQYYVMSYPADPSGSSDNSTPSQFVVVATEDSTEIRIQTDQPIFRYGTVPPVVRLNKGEVYLVQSQAVDQGSRIDLTGTYVESTKPIALFSGHQRAKIPIEDKQRQSRDCLIEQMTPVSTWGRGALLVPYPEPTDAVVFSGDRYRILAAYDSTEVFIDSTYVTTLNAGEFYENELFKPQAVLATRAVMVAQFKHTSSLSTPGSGGGANKLGDPFMMMIPPSNQFLSSYRFVNVQASKLNEFGENVITYEEQWLTIVLPNSAKASLKVDGITPSVTFRPIPKSVYSYVQLRMTDGIHTVEADTGVGIYVYGYGIANSYGYVGGMAYKRYDFNAPKLFGKSECYAFKGFVYDTALADTKVATVVLMRDSINNVNVAIDQFIPPADSVSVTAALIDPLRDGYFKIESRDIEGFVSRKRVDIPGYTLRIVDTAKVVDVLKVETKALGLRRTYCDDYYFINNGKFAQTVNNLRMANAASNFSISAPSFPIVVNPGDTVPFSVCCRFENEGEYSDTVLIDVGCNPRALIVSSVTAGEDTIAPRISYTDNSCRSQRIVLVREDSKYQTGVRSIRVTDSVNCSFTVSFTPTRTVLTAAVADWKNDAWYTLMVTDSAGNTSMLSDTIEGFTLAFSAPDTVGVKRIRESAFLGYSVDTITISNYGSFTKVIDVLPLLQNQIFSIPQHQLPFVLSPGRSKKVEVRYNVRNYPPSGQERWHDTLQLRFGCYTKDLQLVAEVLPANLNGETRCAVGVVSGSLNGVLFITKPPYPNPVVGKVCIELGHTVGATMRVRIADLHGQVHLEQSARVNSGDIVTTELDTYPLPAGVYVLTVSDGIEQVAFPFVVSK
ncbi:MAG: T9SS type A sorting domain-containing protein [Candidatus Kapaibacterium sp.]|jgi:hypothetical protein